jgi:uroporphyrinogen III methyltransferase/synthase
MAWFEKSELFGREILFARTGMERSEMAEGLKRKGAEVVNFPQFEKIPLHHLDIFKQGLETAVTENADILFLSSESVHHFFEGLHLFNVDIRNVRGRFFTGSIKSMRALAKYGCIGQEWSMSFNGSGKLIIFAEEKDKSSETLTEKYGVHQYIATHKNVLNKHSQVILDRILADGNLNTIIFPSAASILRVREGLSEQGKQLIMGNPNIEVICFGEQSAKMAISQNFNISHILTKPTSEHLLNYLTEKAGGRV